MFVFFSENRAVYEIMWKNVVEPERPKMAVKYGTCALHAGLTKARIHTHTLSLSLSLSEYVKIIATARQLFRESASLLRYISSLV